ncbi:MAG: hypothetical protein EXR28_03585 [Betaproteobacteria bacterium]|nr:hypothetical protein [Betaproteobacteria bacterium]
MDRTGNELLTQVGRGTPCGEMLRRYWWPVAVSDHLAMEPQKVRLLGKQLEIIAPYDLEPS